MSASVILVEKGNNIKAEKADKITKTKLKNNNESEKNKFTVYMQNIKNEFDNFLTLCHCTKKEHILNCVVCKGWIIASDNWKKVIGKYKLYNSEKEWGLKILKIFRSINNINDGNCFGDLGEELVRLLIETYLPNEKIRLNNDGTVDKTSIEMPGLDNKYKPDLETDKNIYEVKTRSYTMTGSAGEKILGFYKYIGIPEVKKKPLIYVCVGYQEEEAKKGLHIFENQNNRQKVILKQLEEFGVTYKCASSFIIEKDDKN